MIKNKINILRKKFHKYKIDGYIIPKNDDYFNQKLNNNYIEPHKIQCDKKRCYYSDDNGIFFADGSHISKNGAKLFVKSFENIFK